MKNSHPFAPLGRIIQRYNLTIFIVVLVSGLVASVLLLAATLREADPSRSPTQTQINTSFVSEDATITELNNLHTSSTNPTYSAPAGRLNPFGE